MSEDSSQPGSGEPVDAVLHLSGDLLGEMLTGEKGPAVLNEAQEDARRALLMVHELHRRGYQRLRIVPGMSPSGMYWRFAITPSSNIQATHGALPINEEPQARYSSADGRRYFGWEGVEEATPRELADLFQTHFAELAALGLGRDYPYAGWFVEMLGHVDRAGFPVAYDDGWFSRPNPAPGQTQLPTTLDYESGLPMPPLPFGPEASIRVTNHDYRAPTASEVALDETGLQRILTQGDVEQRWMTLTREIVCAPDSFCICDPDSHGARWSGYVGSAFVDPAFPRKRVLFVGANHNGGAKGLQRTPQMAAYNSLLSSWAKQNGEFISDDVFLREMRKAYKTSWPYWLGVWKIFGRIRDAIGISEDEFAFVNLARCPVPKGKDDMAIELCQLVAPLTVLVEALDARVIFIAKDNVVGRAVPIEGEGGGRLVVRYGSGSRGLRNNMHPSEWIDLEAPAIRQFMGL